MSENYSIPLINGNSRVGGCEMSGKVDKNIKVESDVMSLQWLWDEGGRVAK